MRILVARRDKLEMWGWGGVGVPPLQDPIALGWPRYHGGEGPCFLFLNAKAYKHLVQGLGSEILFNGRKMTSLHLLPRILR